MLDVLGRRVLMDEVRVVRLVLGLVVGGGQLVVLGDLGIRRMLGWGVGRVLGLGIGRVLGLRIG